MLYLFAYGTLQRGHRNAHILRHEPRWMTPAIAKGFELWHLDPHDHPAILHAADRDALLHGTLFCYEDTIGEQVLLDCDALEDFYPDSPEESRYLRELTHVVAINDFSVPREVDAHVYLWHPRHAASLRAHHTRVLDGHWANFHAARRQERG